MCLLYHFCWTVLISTVVKHCAKFQRIFKTTLSYNFKQTSLKKKSKYEWMQKTQFLLSCNFTNTLNIAFLKSCIVNSINVQCPLHIINGNTQKINRTYQDFIFSSKNQALCFNVNQPILYFQVEEILVLGEREMLIDR